MTIGESRALAVEEAGGGSGPEELSVAGVLRLLSAGACGAIVMALGEGPLRTKELTERVPGYAPRTIYRYTSKLAQIGVIERNEEPGVPSKVVHNLTEPSGSELQALVEAYAKASLSRLPNGEISSHDWGALALLADLWESGMLDELNFGPRSPTELARGEHGWSFHQVSRRAGLFAIGGFIAEVPTLERRRKYLLTDKSRRAMALIAGIGRWRRKHVAAAKGIGLTVDEVAELMRTALPLVSLPDQAGRSFVLEIVPDGGEAREVEFVWGEIGADGAVASGRSPLTDTDASARGSSGEWVDAVFEGPRDGLSGRGDAQLLDEGLQELHAALWRQPDGQAAHAAPAAPDR